MNTSTKKGFSPILLCLLIAATVTGIVGVFLLVLALAGKWPFTNLMTVLALLFFFGASYLTSYLYIKQYLQSRLGQIYKAIYQHHQSDQVPQRFSMSSKAIDKVGADVSQWAQELDSKVKTQTQLANYRRQFIGNFSHEIQTPIFNIQGYLDTLIDGAIHDESVRDKYLNQAAKNVTRLKTIVNDLTTISKLEYNQVVINQVDFDVIALVLDVFDELTLKAHEMDIKLVLDSHHKSFLNIKGDPLAIRQVLVNLISNSIHYGKPNGTTTVNLLNMDTYVIIQVNDDGIGIAAEHINHLCDRFYRVSKSRSRIKGGSGLGLSIVKHILEAHKQSLSISSVLGKGSTFAFQLEK